MDIHQTQFLGHNRSLSFAGQICGAAEWGASGDRGTWRTTIGDLARSYARVMRMGENDEYYRDQQEDFSPMEGIWENQGLYNYANYTPGAIPVTAPVAYNENLPGLQKLLRGQTSAAGAVVFVDRLLQASTRVESLHRFYNNFQQARYIQYGGFLRELTEFGFEIMRVKPTTTVGSNPVSEWIENLLEGNGSEASLKLAAEGLAQMFDGFKLNVGSESMYEVGDGLDYMGRLVQVAEAVDDVKLDQEVLKASMLSHLVNLGGAYVALNPNKNGAINFFLDTAWASQSDLPNLQQSILSASNELEVFLTSYSRLQPKQELELAKNTLWAISKIPSNYIQEQFVSPIVVQTWIKDVLSYTNIQMSLQTGETLLDHSQLFEAIQKITDRQSAKTVAIQLYDYITPEPIQTASTGSNNLIAQESIGDAIRQGLWELTIAIGGTIGYIVVDGSGRVARIIFKSSSETDNRTDEEKVTDEAIAETLKGTVPTDSQGNPLAKGDAKRLKRKGKDVENYEKPEGDATTMREDIEKLANDTNTTVEVRQSAEGTVRILDLPSGQQARTYPKSTSGKDPTLQIDLRQKGRSIKIRYRKGSNQGMTILIPVA
jgi:hypothetical protein